MVYIYKFFDSPGDSDIILSIDEITGSSTAKSILTLQRICFIREEDSFFLRPSAATSSSSSLVQFLWALLLIMLAALSHGGLTLAFQPDCSFSTHPLTCHGSVCQGHSSGEASWPPFRLYVSLIWHMWSGCHGQLIEAFLWELSPSVWCAEWRKERLKVWKS